MTQEDHSSAAANTQRLFLAARAPAPVVEAALRALRSGHWPQGRDVAQDAAHLTLLFLGEVPSAQMFALRAELHDLLAQAPVATCAPRAIGSLDSRARSHVVALILDPTPSLLALLRALRRAPLESAPGSDRREPIPHITLRRLRSPASLGPSVDIALPPWTVCEALLMRSTQTPAGTEHTLLAAIPIGVPPPRRAAPPHGPHSSDTQPSAPDRPK